MVKVKFMSNGNIPEQVKTTVLDTCTITEWKMASQVDNEKPTRRKVYSREQLTAAIDAVKEQKISITSAAKKFSVPRTTLRDHVSGRVSNFKKPGINAMLTDEEEDELVSHMVYMAKHNMPLSRKDLRRTILDKICTSDPDRVLACKFNLERGPSDQWIHSFYERHNELKLIVADDNRQKRPSTQYELDQFYNIYENLLSSLNLKDKPAQIFNCNKTGIDGHVTPLEKPCAIHDEINCQLKLANDDHITSLMTVSAAGHVLPSMLLYQKSIPSENDDHQIPLGWSCGVSPKGYIDKDLFRKWFSDIFFKNCGSERPLLLLLDKNMNQIGMDVVQTAIANEIHILCVPAHASNLIQPLDIGVFNLIKQKYNQICIRCHGVPQNNVARSSIPTVWKSAIEQAASVSVLEGAFRRAGIHPFDPCAIDYGKVKQSPVVKKPKPLNSVTVPPFKDAQDSVSSQEPSTSNH